MASLTKRAVILIICRVMNYGVMLLSPIFLVRVFDVHAYGQYREFILYAMLFSGLIGFSVNTNLLYFIPKYPARERQSVTSTALLILLASIVGTAAILLAGDVLRGRMSYDFVVPLAAYVFFFVNLDFYEHFWLGKKRTDYVLYFSSARIAARTLVVVGIAYTTRNVRSVIWGMVAIEAVKCALMLALFRRFFSRAIDLALVREQLRFVVPLGSSSVLSLVNSQIANLAISLKMGVERLALYSIGSQQIPVINIVRSSVMDVLFPEMTQTDDAGRLALWRRANVVFCFLIFPLYAVFFYFARTFIETLFTAQYIDAVPLFRIYLSIILLQCFEMGTPLRAINRNTYFIAGSLITLAVNIGFILAFFGAFGFLTPGLAYVLAEASAVLYIGRMILSLYHLEIRELFLWGKILRIVAACAISVPVLLADRLLRFGAIPEAIVLGLAYAAVYFALVRSFRIQEVELLVEKMKKQIRR